MSDRRQVLKLGAGAVGAALVGPALLSEGAMASSTSSSPGSRLPLVIGHRGAAGYRPEHTLASYELAARMGADFIEPDLVTTSDGVLIVRHEPEFGGTTNVASHPEFAGRRTTKLLDGVSVTGWFTEDFTLAEIKTLRAIERLPGVRQRNTMYDGLFDVPTFEEVLNLRERLSHELRREIGVYPETKHPTYFRAQGLALEPALVAALRKHNLDHRDSPVFVQSFEFHNLEDLRHNVGLRSPMVFLGATSGTPFNDPRPYADYFSRAGLAEIATTVNGVGPDKNQLIPRKADGTLDAPTSVISDAHAAGLVLHPYTFRAENQFLPAELRVGTDPNAYGHALDEHVIFLNAGIDGVFTDQADIGVLARSMWAATR
ncbi:MAG TPA: glycerophosphodiester phosphodiesterase [Micromonosporaceae bacterium]|nr:glycerophosphodiester phosphodiesterase [Micromonosporaceae bacterium]